MKMLSLLFALGLTVVAAGVAYVGERDESGAAAMTAAAQKFLDSLSDEQKAKATFAFDSEERFNWQFMRDRAENSRYKGLPLEEMTAQQRKTALDLLKAGTSSTGNDQATTIMSLESLFPELAKKGGAVRNPHWYFFTVFGKPAATGKWGWRVQGHHLSLNFTLQDGKVIAVTPVFFGAEPVEVKRGPRKGLRLFAEADDLGKQLFAALDDKQRKSALQDKAFPRIEARSKKATAGEPVGLAAARMTKQQQELLLRLLHAYTDRLPADVGKAQFAEIKDAGIDKIHFAFTGSVEPGQKHAYRLQGPTFRIDFSNEQNDSDSNAANHVHSVWRNLKGDFGLAAR
jgi:hypothetical protein